jgi:hypothetical protein
MTVGNRHLMLERPDGSVITVPFGDLTRDDRRWVEERRLQIRELNRDPRIALVALQENPKSEIPRPLIAKCFEPFLKRVGLRWNRDLLFVESDGMPDHKVMVGITAWQQQVPLAQPYSGSNAWQIPLHPVPARNPMSAKTNFFRGAIALAVNGVPIFNPIKNDGRTDTLLAGELDQWGGHCGRADDYHYHIAPDHLEKMTGKGKPIAFALDGYPIYGYLEADGSKPKGLDKFNGHKDAAGNYHYHATKTYPYLNGGFYGEVVERGGQVDPQPRGQPLRPALRPLRGAKITGFVNPKPGSFRVDYDVYGERRSIGYDVAEVGSAVFRFADEGGTRTETYQPRVRRGADQRPEDRPPQGGERRPPAGGNRGGGDPLTRALDRNGDGTIDRAELARAAEVLRTLDRNRDGRITRDELRGGGGRPRRDDRPPRR